MKIIIDTTENIAKKAAQRYVELLSKKPDAVLGGATGSTPLGLYAELVKLNKEGKVSFKNASAAFCCSFPSDSVPRLDTGDSSSPSVRFINAANCPSPAHTWG